MKGIRYKDTTAMPGSELFKLLSEGKAKEADRSYQATAQRERDLLAKADLHDHQRHPIAGLTSSPTTTISV